MKKLITLIFLLGFLGLKAQTYVLEPPYYVATDSTTKMDSVLDTWIVNPYLQPVNAYLHALNRAVPHWIKQNKPNKVDTIYRTKGKDSLQYKINGRYHAILDSAGGGGGSGDSGIAKGYGINVTQVKPRVISVDTSKIATKNFAQNIGYVSNDSVGTDSAHIYINGKTRAIENDTVYRVGSGNKGAGNGVAITLKYVNCVDGERITTLYYKATTKYSQITFPSGAGGVAYTIAQSGHYSTVSGQTVTFQTTSGTSIYEIITNVTKYRYIISIVWIQ